MNTKMKKVQKNLRRGFVHTHMIFAIQAMMSSYFIFVAPQVEEPKRSLSKFIDVNVFLFIERICRAQKESRFPRDVESMEIKTGPFWYVKSTDELKQMSKMQKSNATTLWSGRIMRLPRHKINILNGITISTWNISFQFHTVFIYVPLNLPFHFIFVRWNTNAFVHLTEQRCNKLYTQAKWASGVGEWESDFVFCAENFFLCIYQLCMRNACAHAFNLC